MQRSPSTGDVHTAAVNRLSSGSGTPELYDLLSATIYGLALRLCSTPAGAGSVCTKVFSYICRNHTEYDANRTTVMQWVTQLTYRFAVLSADEDAASRRVAEVLPCDELTARQRHDLVAAYFGGLTYREIARRTGADPSQVCDTLRSALRGLQAPTGPEA